MAEQWEIEWKDYYDIVELEPDATPEEIEEAYRVLASAFHPDRYRTERGRQRKTKKFQRLQEAYEYLRDPDKRAMYDQEYTRRARAKTAQGQASPSTAREEAPVRVIVPEDVDVGAAKAGQTHAAGRRFPSWAVALCVPYYLIMAVATGLHYHDATYKQEEIAHALEWSIYAWTALWVWPLLAWLLFKLRSSTGLLGWGLVVLFVYYLVIAFGMPAYYTEPAYHEGRALEWSIGLWALVWAWPVVVWLLFTLVRAASTRGLGAAAGRNKRLKRF